MYIYVFIYTNRQNTTTFVLTTVYSTSHSYHKCEEWIRLNHISAAIRKTAAKGTAAPEPTEGPIRPRNSFLLHNSKNANTGHLTPETIHKERAPRTHPALDKENT
jgi:prephenate dehydratase